MLLASFTTTYSLNFICSLVPCTGTFVMLISGYISVMSGGIVSFGPPLGGVVVFAHECENIIVPSTKAMGIAGKNLDINLFIFI